MSVALYAMLNKNEGRRPVKQYPPEQLKERIRAYFTACQIQEEPPTVTGLALALGLSSREQLGEFRTSARRRLIARALMRIEEEAEQRLFTKEYYNGAKLFLEVNFGRWSGRGGEFFDAAADLQSTSTASWAQ